MADKVDKVRVTADLPPSVMEKLRQVAEAQDISLTEALRRAITTEALLQERRRQGAKVLLEKDGKFSEVVFHG